MERTFRTPLAVLTGVTLTVAMIVFPAPAQAAERPTFKTLRTLPFVGHGDQHDTGDGGRGTVKLNTAVANSCNEGAPIISPQWFFIGEKTRGSLRVAMDAYYFSHHATSWDTGTAVVDHWTGKVLTCSTSSFSRSKRPVDVVGYLSRPVDMDLTEGDEPHINLLIDRVSTVPPSNDRMEDAEQIPSLPFQDDLDTAQADADGPGLGIWHCDFAGIISEESNTVWYRYRPTQDGPAPLVTVRDTTGWTGANERARGDNLRDGILEVLPDGGTRLVENDDPFDCDTVFTLKAGTDYLIGVYYGWDSYVEGSVATGGPVSVSVTAR